MQGQVENRGQGREGVVCARGVCASVGQDDGRALQSERSGSDGREKKEEVYDTIAGQGVGGGRASCRGGSVQLVLESGIVCWV